MKTDENGMLIGDGSYHAPYYIENFEGRSITAKVEESIGTESVYVTYTNHDNLKVAKVRFSYHICNGIKFGDYINGNAPREMVRLQILHALGLAEFYEVPVAPYIKITKQYISKKKVSGREVLEISERDIKQMSLDTDFSQFVGKIVREYDAFVEIKKIQVVTNDVKKELREI